MNILFITMSNFTDINRQGIYTDLIREFVKNGENIYVVSPAERRYNEKTSITNNQNYTLLRIKVGNLQKTNLIEKGISTLLIQFQFIAGIKKYFHDIRFDLILYSTPPITFANVIKYVKKRDASKTYLILKDIFPQNAVDLQIFSKKSILYKYFRRKEKSLYKISDHIGCMSLKNVEYILEHNNYVDKNKIDILPNCIEIKNYFVEDEKKNSIRKKYNIPENKKLFIYGGNLGKPQGIPFLLECLQAESKNSHSFFLIAGDGTEYSKIENYINETCQQNVRLIKRLPNEEYYTLLSICDVGLIFLDERFTIPNYPSRILDYMLFSLPVYAITDTSTDIGTDIENGKFGWWSESGDIDAFKKTIFKIEHEELNEYKNNSFNYLKENFDIKYAYKKINEFIN